MATEKKTDSAPEGIPEQVSESMLAISDEVMAGAFPDEETPPGPEPEKKGEEQVKAEPVKQNTPPEKKPVEEPAKEEPKAETESAKAETTTEEPFDPVAWAEAENLPPDLVRHCKSPIEAARAVAKRLRNREVLDGRKDQELADLRTKVATQPAPAQKPDTTQVAPQGTQTAKTGAEVTAGWTQEQVERFHEWEERAPQEASAWMFQQQIAPVLEAVQAEYRRDLEQIRQEMAAAKDAPREAGLEKEYVEFTAAHPEDHEAFTSEEMPILAQALGLPPTTRDGKPPDVGATTGTKLEDLYDLSRLRKDSPKMYVQIVRDMRQGVEFQRARRIAELELGASAKPAEAAAKAKNQVQTARAASATPASAGTAPLGKTATTLRDLPDECFEV